MVIGMSVHVEHVMGTAVSIDIRDGAPPPGAIDRAVAWLHAVDETFSPFRASSAVSRLGDGTLPVEDASDDVRWVVERCAALRAETDGAFDAWATGRFDPSALVKGWAVQRAADRLLVDGAPSVCVTAGGDIAVRGPRTWRVGIRHPLDPMALAGVVAIRNEAIATSGTYERGSHIVDPVSGLPPSGVLSITVIGPDLGTADAYATAAFAKGKAGPEWTAGLNGYEAMTILADATVLTTWDWPAPHEVAA
jgi:thiamine biosynthesis lipoprotein